MTSYYSISDYGLLLDEKTIKTIIQKISINNKPLDEDDFAYALYEYGVCEYIGQFTGEALPLADDGVICWGTDNEAYNDDFIVYVQVTNYPTLFKKSYNNIGEIIDELKAKVGEYLPKDFDYRNKIRYICGVYYG